MAKNVRVTINMEIDDEFVDELKQIVDHKIDALLDYDEFPEINDIYGCKMEIID
jgi:hypothetical protein